MKYFDNEPPRVDRKSIILVLIAIDLIFGSIVIGVLKWVSSDTSQLLFAIGLILLFGVGVFGKKST